MSMRLFVLVIYVSLTVFPSVNGCGQIPAGRDRTINFTVTNFQLPAVMAFSEDPDAKIKVPSISTTKSGSETFLRMLIKQSVDDVLYEQGRSALLSDYVISSILQQLDVQISYEPLNCIRVITDLTMNNQNVANICRHQGDGCMMANKIAANTMAIPPQHLSISGSLKTSNAIMASWSNQMWQRVLNRVLRRIASSQNGKYFYGASVFIR